MNPIEVMTESDNEEALKFVDELWDIVKYLDIETQRDYNNMVYAIVDFERWKYPF